MAKSSREIIKTLNQNRWVEVRRVGSHAQFKHPDNPLLVTVPHPKRDLPRGTVRSIEKASGLKF